MKTLNELTPKERLELYKKALLDWTERPYDELVNTNLGLCAYFKHSHKINAYRKDVWGNICIRPDEFIYVLRGREFLGHYGEPLPRIAALNAMIKELEEIV